MDWHVTRERLRRVADEVEDVRGWDFSNTRTQLGTAPWKYNHVIRRYLRPMDEVLDIGTGGGERFLALAPVFGGGIGGRRRSGSLFQETAAAYMGL